MAVGCHWPPRSGEGPVRSVQAALRSSAVLTAVLCLSAPGPGLAGPVPHVSGSVRARLMSAVAPARGGTAGRAVAREQVAAAVACAKVFFLGARGSGEAATLPFHGLGPEVNAMALAVRKFLTAAGVTGQYAFRTLNVGYPADSVNDLAPTSQEIQDFESANPALVAAGVQAYSTNNLGKYLSSISQGISATVSEARYVYQQCPHSLLIFAGYSQGAMVMHQAEQQLQAAGDNGLLGQIAGTLLLGDGNRIPNTLAQEFGTSSAKSEGIQTWAVSTLKIGSGHEVVDPATTANICNAGDIVCATSFKVLENAAAGIKVHTSYVTAKACLTAGTCADVLGNYSHLDPALMHAAEWAGQLAAGRILGSQWNAAITPLPANAAANPSVYISSMACYSASWCAAAGTYADSSGETLGLLLTKSGTAWSAATAPLPSGSGTANVNLLSVACPSASSCVAVGYYHPNSGGGGGLIETSSGTGWSAATAPLPPPDPGYQSQGGSLTSVACPSASTCVADGTYGEYDPSTGEGLERGMVLIDSGGTWTAVQPPLPPTGEAGSARFAPNSPATVACPAATWCTAIGSYHDNTAGNNQGLLLTWSGGAWTAARAPAPSGNTGVQPSAIACPAVSSCTMIGIYYDSAGYARGLINTGAGSAWTLTKLRGNDLFSVACQSVTSCIITGLGGIWTGSGATWQATAAPALLSGDYLGPVACPPTGPCAIAAATYDNSALQIMAGAPASWTGFDVTSPGPTANLYFNAIACPAASTCIAVGSANGQGVAAAGPS